MYKSISLPGSRFLFLTCCIMGFVLGAVISAGMDDSFLPLMRLASAGLVSIVCCILRGLLPFLIAAFAVKIHSFPVLSLVGFSCCLLHGWAVWIAVRTFGTCAWLVQPLLQFSGNIQASSLIVFGQQHCRGRRVSRWEVGIYVFLILMVSVLDYFAVSPFLQAILES